MRTTPKILAVAAVASALLLSACGGGGSTGTGAATSASPSAPASSTPSPSPIQAAEAKWDDAVEFATLVHTEKYKDAGKLVTPGSTAQRYLEHQLNAVKAQKTNGDYAAPDEPTIESDADKRTITFSFGNDIEYTWSKFVPGDDGKIASWTGASGSIGKVLAKTQPRASANGQTVKILSAYLANSGALIIVTEITATKGTAEVDWQPKYVAKDGLAYEPAQFSAPQDISKGSKGLAMYVYEDSDFGGKFTYQTHDANYKATNLRMVVK